MAEELKTNNMKRGAKGPAFKMKGYSYPGTSPAKQTTDPEKKELTAKTWVEADVESTKVWKGSKRENLAANLSKRYGTEITKKDGVWSNAEGVSVADLEAKYLEPKTQS